MSSNSLKVGITGGIGAGKSIACQVFRLLGAPVYNADDRAKWLMNHSDSLREKISTLFGSEAYKEGTLNRPFIAETAFSNPKLLEQLNGLVHPEVAFDYQVWHEEQSFLYTLKEAALLFESGSHKQLDRLITVTAPQEMRIERVMKRDPQRSREDILDIMHKQWPEAEKASNADFVIVNDGKVGLIDQVLAIHNSLMKHAR